MGITEGAGPKELSKIYAEADATRARADGAALMLPHRLAPTPSLPQEQMQQVEALTRSPYGPELGWYREWLLAEHRTYRQLGLLSKVGFILMSELKLFFMGFFLGIKLLWNTAIQLALETLDSDIKYKGSKEVHTGAVADKFTGRLHVLTVLEANNAGLLQLLLQTLIFVTHPGSINPYVFAFSLSCSALVVWNALSQLTSNYDAIVRVLHPPASVYEAQALVLAVADQADPPTLLSAILKAQEMRVPIQALLPAVARLMYERKLMLRARVEDVVPSRSTLKAEGYVAAELRAAGHARMAKAEGFFVDEVKMAGYSSVEALEANYTAVEAYSVGFTPAEMKAAQYPVAEANAAGFSMSKLHAAGYTAAEAWAGGIAAAVLHSGGYSAPEAKAAGYVLSELQAAGYLAAEAREAGYSAAQVNAAGYPPAEVKRAGFSFAEARAIWSSLSELKMVGYLAWDAMSAGASSAELRAAGYTAEEVKAAEHTRTAASAAASARPRGAKTPS